MASGSVSAQPLPVYNYRVSIGHESMGFAEVSGLKMEYEAVTYRHGLSFVMGPKLIPGMPQTIKVSLKRGIGKNSGFLAQWIKDAYSGFRTGNKQDIVIDLCDETGAGVVRWIVVGAMPIKIDAPTFDAKSNDVAIEVLELIAAEIKISYDP
jgi:phage tail-like protein